MGAFFAHLYRKAPAKESRKYGARALKHYWRFLDSEALELKALSQGMGEKAA